MINYKGNLENRKLFYSVTMTLVACAYIALGYREDNGLYYICAYCFISIVIPVLCTMNTYFKIGE